MGFWFDSFLTELIVLVVFSTTLLVIYAKYTFGHWTRHGFKQLEPSFPFGNMKDFIIQKESRAISYQKQYNYFKSKNVPYGGVYFALRPDLALIDPDIINTILIKDFQHFTDRGLFNDEKCDPLSANLFALDGQQWKNMRVKLTPTFTSGKMKMMFHTVVACTVELDNIFQEKAMKSEPLDAKNVLARFTADVISSCAFGVESNALKETNSDFINYGTMAFEPRGIEIYRQILGFLAPGVLKAFNIPSMNKKISNFFLTMVKDTVTYREENNVFRKDLMHLLLQLKNQGKLSEDDGSIKGTGKCSDSLSIEQIAAQCFVFFLAGYESSSTTMTFCLYELATNPNIQEKVREEIKTVFNKYNGELTYEAMIDMHYLDKVVNETLRKFPPLSYLLRRCNQEYKLPNTNYTFKKGDFIRMSTLGIQRDAEYYPNPEQFDPERFSDEEKAKRPHCTFMPFGEGPRNCIGQRFGLMQIKIGLIALLRHCKLTLNNKTEVPLVMDPSSFMLSTLGGIWLDVQKV